MDDLSEIIVPQTQIAKFKTKIASATENLKRCPNSAKFKLSLKTLKKKFAAAKLVTKQHALTVKNSRRKIVKHSARKRQKPTYHVDHGIPSSLSSAPESSEIDELKKQLKAKSEELLEVKNKLLHTEGQLLHTQQQVIFSKNSTFHSSQYLNNRKHLNNCVVSIWINSIY